MTTFQVWKYKNGIWQILDWGETWDKELPKKILRSASDGQAYAIRRDGNLVHYNNAKQPATQRYMDLLSIPALAE